MDKKEFQKRINLAKELTTKELRLRSELGHAIRAGTPEPIPSLIGQLISGRKRLVQEVNYGELFGSQDALNTFTDLHEIGDEYPSLWDIEYVNDFSNMMVEDFNDACRLNPEIFFLMVKTCIEQDCPSCLNSLSALEKPVRHLSLEQVLALEETLTGCGISVSYDDNALVNALTTGNRQIAEHVIKNIETQQADNKDYKNPIFDAALDIGAYLGMAGKTDGLVLVFDLMKESAPDSPDDKIHEHIKTKDFLFSAASQGFSESVETVLKHRTFRFLGSDRQIITSSLGEAAKKGYLPVIKTLLKFAPSTSCEFAASAAMYHQQHEVTEFLLDRLQIDRLKELARAHGNTIYGDAAQQLISRMESDKLKGKHFGETTKPRSSKAGI